MSPALHPENAWRQTAANASSQPRPTASANSTRWRAQTTNGPFTARIFTAPRPSHPSSGIQLFLERQKTCQRKETHAEESYGFKQNEPKQIYVYLRPILKCWQAPKISLSFLSIRQYEWGYHQLVEIGRSPVVGQSCGYAPPPRQDVFCQRGRVGPIPS